MLFYLAMIEDSSDQSKFEELYMTYKKTMFYVANNILRDTYLAEDAVHQAFIRIIENLDKINPTDCHKTRSFIVILMKNVAIDIYRKRKQENVNSYHDMEFIINEMAATKEFEEEVENEIITTIASLPFNYSSVLMLKYSQGYSDSEISKILSISESNVRQRIVRAKKMLKSILNKKEVEEKEDANN